MIAKIFAVVSHDAPKETFEALAEAGRCHGYATGAEKETSCMLYMIEPKHYHTRGDVSKLSGVVVLPGVHDPAPIGDLHKHLAHVDAEPHHTMREVARRLSSAHGPVFDPDT